MNQGNQDPQVQTPGIGMMYEDWKQRTPAASRFCVHLAILSIVGSIFQVPSWLTGNCVRSVFEYYQVWRVLVSHFVDYSFFQAIFGAFWLYICASRIEKVKGSVFTFHSYVACSLLSNVLFTLLSGFFAYNPWSPVDISSSYFSSTTGDEIEYDNPFLCSYGPWATIFALLVLETSISNEDKRRFLCFPWMIETKYYPLVLFLLFELLNTRLDVAIGLGVGYLFSYVTWLQISVSRNRSWENASWLKWLTEKDNFVGVDNGGTALPGVWSSPPQENSGMGFSQAMPWGAGSATNSGQWGSGSGGSTAGGGGGGRVMGVGDVRGQGQQPRQSQQPQSGGSGGTRTDTSSNKSSVFSGQGHSLQSTGTSSRPQGTHPLAAAYERQHQTATRLSPPPRDTQTQETETIIDIPTEVIAAEPWPHALPEAEEKLEQEPKPDQDTLSISETQIQNLMDLGYTRDDALPALEFSNGDINGAVDYLQGNVD